MLRNYLPTDYQNFIALSRYARWKENDQRRENWGETVDRYFSYMTKHLKDNHKYDLTKALKEIVKNEKAEVIIISAAIESDISELDSYEDRISFLNDLGLTESGVAKLITASYKLLNLIYYNI